MQKEKYISFLNEYLSPKKLSHSLGVAATAQKLANIYYYDEDDAYTAGLLHDAARELPNNKILDILRENNYSFFEEDYKVPEVLHGPAAVFLLKQELGITNKNILQAISRHTTGDAGMTVLDAIIFISDMIEPNRNYPGVQDLRTLAEKDLFKALISGLQQTIQFLNSRKQFIHPRTIDTYNWLLKEGKLREEI